MPKKKAIVAPSATPESYNEVVDTAHLIDVKLIASEFKATPGYFNAKDGNLKRLYACDQTSGAYNSESKTLLGMFSFEAGAKFQRKWVLQAKSTYLVIFSIDGSPSEDAALAYVARIGRFACHPYFRGHFAELCSAAGAEEPPLPVITGNLPTKVSSKPTTVD